MPADCQGSLCSDKTSALSEERRWLVPGCKKTCGFTFASMWQPNHEQNSNHHFGPVWDAGLIFPANIQPLMSSLLDRADGNQMRSLSPILRRPRPMKNTCEEEPAEKIRTVAIKKR